MRIYFKDDEHYPATYSFKDDVVGEDPNTNWTVTDGIGYTCQVIAEVGDHKKVVEMYDDDNVNTISMINEFDEQITETIEGWFRSSNMAEYATIRMRDGGTECIYLRFGGDKLQYYDGAYKDVIVPLLDNTWYHWRLDFRCADNHYDIYIDGVKEITDADFRNGGTALDEVRFTTYSVRTNPFYCYWDAIGFGWDTDYTVGDNTEDYDWTRVSAVVEFPEVTARNNLYGLCTVVLRDFEGALYSDWYSRDLTEMLITDDTANRGKDCNIIFRGILTNKRFHDRDLALEISGIGIHLRRRSFGADEVENYILAEGVVIGTPALLHSSKLYLQESDGVGGWQDFTGWDNDYWISNERNVGIMIKDTTAGYDTEVWNAEDPLVLSGSTQYATETGDFADTNTFDDGEPYYECKIEYPDVGGHIFTLNLTPTMEGVVIPNTNSLEEIKIEWNYQIKGLVHGALAHQIIKCRLQIYNGNTSTWDIIPGSTKTFDHTVGLYSTTWCQGVSEANGGTGNEYIIQGTDTELANYFTEVVNDYDHITGLRLNIDVKTIYETTTGYTEVVVDFLQITPKFNADDVDPIMKEITGSGIDGDGSYIDVNSVPYWDEMGITIDVDMFQIGQNTLAIIEDISDDAGIPIDVEKVYDQTTYRKNVYPNADTATIEWTSTAADHYTEVSDGSDLTFVDTGVDTEEDIYDYGGINLHGGYVATITIYHRQKCDVIDKELVEFSYSTDGGTSWSSTKYDDLTVNWVNENSAWSTLEIYDLSDFQVKLAYSQAFAGSAAYVSDLYVEFKLKTSNWNKYIARKFKGKHCIDALKTVQLLEGAEWMEDYSNNRLKLIKKVDYVDSTVSITQTDYDHDWEYEDQCNQVKYVYVWGRSTTDADTQVITNVKAKAVDYTNESENSVQIIDNSIWTNVEAQTIADAQLTLLKDKRPSIRIPLLGINEDLQLGTYTNVTMARPTVVAADYPIRMITRSKHGKTAIKTVVYCGFGETQWDEKIMKVINENTALAQKGLSDYL